MAGPVSNPSRSPFRPGSLRDLVGRVRDAAVAKGALLSIPTDEVRLREGEVEYRVRVVQSLDRKEAERRRRAGMGDPTAGAPASSGSGQGGQGEAFNPFLPYDEDLYVADVTDSHVAVLNKFNVVEDHLLVVTRSFEHQDRLLGSADFEALFRCLDEYDALGFYNGGTVAGASQAHKHLQTVPLPLGTGGPAFPLAPLLKGAGPAAVPTVVEGLDFRHAFVRLPPRLAGADPARTAQEGVSLYQDLLGAIDRPLLDGPHGTTCAPYNLLCTRDWMMTVPRVRECFEGISLNSLAFVGAMLVRDRAQVERLRSVGPSQVLAHVAGRR